MQMVKSEKEQTFGVFLYDPKIAKTKKSEIVVVMDPIEDMIVRLEGFLLKKSDKIMIVKTTKRHWFVFDIRDDSQVFFFFFFFKKSKKVFTLNTF